ncbi:MAG: MYXO-CTERM sorting domain-containing protein [Myxococcota bacterium]
MTIVDRSAATTTHFDYTISQEDTELTPDEVEDSRTHQFFGFCRAHDPQTFLPRWITQDDIDRAVQVKAAPDEVEAEDILDTSTEWGDCSVRITADDDRRPITFEAADAGVDWDTTDVPAGTYTVEAYTWEPPLNIWSLHPGVVKVVDSSDVAASGPAHAITNTEEVINRNETVTLEGCVSAMEGSTLTAYYALALPEVDWQVFIEDDPISGDSYAVEFDPPEEVAGESLIMRIDVTDPMGRTYTNYMRELVIILGTDGPGECDGMGFIGGAGCEGDSGGTETDGDAATSAVGDETAGDGTSASTTPGQDGGDGVDPGGCGCQSDSTPTPWALGLLGVVLWGRRRRNR